MEEVNGSLNTIIPKKVPYMTTHFPLNVKPFSFDFDDVDFNDVD